MFENSCKLTLELSVIVWEVKYNYAHRENFHLPVELKILKKLQVVY